MVQRKRNETSMQIDNRSALNVKLLDTVQHWLHGLAVKDDTEENDKDERKMDIVCKRLSCHELI